MLEAMQSPEEGSEGSQGSVDDTSGSVLVERAYLELREVAERLLGRERADHTLQPTALVHEAWLKLGTAGPFGDRTHFVAASARAMRRVLVDHARGRGRYKRGGQWQRVALDGLRTAEEDGEVDLVELDVALSELEQAAPRQARLVELRFFGGFEVDEAAALLDVSPITAARDWRFARAWLARRLSDLGLG
jgi:RNA polymerase sigma-70 factor (ECF subfamily)